MKTADLHNYLSRHITLEDFTAFRSERDTGMFSNIPLDSKFESKTRLIALRKILKATDLDIHEYLGRYETSFAKTETLFDRIMTKEKLTLADAMEICKFAPDSYIDKVLELIKNVEIVDNRFKSLTFYKGMAEEWISDLSADNMKIMQNVTVKKGANGTYTGLNNKQAEFVLDNNDKLIRFVDAKYNKELGRFELDSIVENAT